MGDTIMKKMSLKFKLITMLLGCGLLPLIILSFYSFNRSSSMLEKEAIDRLDAVKSIKGEAVSEYFNTIRDQILTFSDNVMIKESMIGFSETFKTYSSELSASVADIIIKREHLKSYYINEFGKKYEAENSSSVDYNSIVNSLSDTEVLLQYHYISKNSNPLGSKEGLDFANDGTNYSNLHKKYHPSIRKFLAKFGYYDIFLIDIESGNIVYSVFKELDFATSLTTGPYNDTNFAKAFNLAKNANKKDDFFLVDYKKYTPSYDSPASFISSPIFDGNKKVGVAIFQMPIDRLNSIMGARAGMGESGETYLVGQDGFMRSDSFLDNKNFNVVTSFKSGDEGKIESEPLTLALDGKAGSGIYKNYLGHEVISAYKPINILGNNWALIADYSTEEAFASVSELQNIITLLIVLTSAFLCLVAFLFSTKLSNSITGIVENLIKNAKELAHSSNQIDESSDSLSDASSIQASSLQETVSSIDEISSMVQRNADAANSSTQVSSNSQSAAQKGKHTVEEMISAIQDISSSNDEIMDEMQKNTKDISKIVNVISEIGDKTKVINDIVFQTKLLSFNASVEAARAGEHGKGFAVVAEEVGNLASMSGKAALEITEMLDSSIKEVTSIVENTKEKVEVLVKTGRDKVEKGTQTATYCGDALDEILTNVASVNEMVQEIASASSEQSTGIQEVTKAMQQLDKTTHQNSAVAKESSALASKLNKQASSLNYSIEELIKVVKGSSSQADLSTNQSEAENNNKNVINFEEKKSEQTQFSQPLSSEKEEHNNSVKVAGLDTSIPSKDDPRFEDF
jgi:methyl-accepting chemotaxis protein